MPIYIEFEIISAVTNRRTIAVGNRIRDLQRLNEEYGRGRWRKMSGEAYIRFPNGDVVYAEIHWYEAVRREAVRELAGKPSSGRELYH